MKGLHFAGYDFSSGPDGTVIHRDKVRPKDFSPGDRVSYKDVNLRDEGRVTKVDGQWVWVQWFRSEGKGAVKEWGPNLRKVDS